MSWTGASRIGLETMVISLIASRAKERVRADAPYAVFRPPINRSYLLDTASVATYLVVVQSSLKVVLVEDHLAYRESLALALSTVGSIQVVGQATRGRDAYPLIAETLPDVTVVDFMLPDTDGVSLARELRRRKLRTRIMILGRLGHPLFVRDAMRSGVSGFALKKEPLADLIQAIKRVASGQSYLSPHVLPALEAGPREEDAGLERLSLREREIFVMLLEGLSTKEIAQSLFLSAKTVDAHRLHINRKLGVRSPAELARLVADQGLLAG